MDKRFEKLKAILNASGKKLPKWLRGIQGNWRLFSALGIVFTVLAVLFAILGHLVFALVFTGLVILFFILSNLWLHAHVVAPILELGDTARRIAAGSYGALAEKRREDELGALTDAINDMSVKICTANQTQTEFISSVSHELRTPLTAIAGWSETMLYDEAIQGDSRRGVNIILKESGRLTNMVEELLEFSRIRDGRFTLNFETFDICAEVEDIVFTYGKLLGQEGVELVYEPADEDIPPLSGDPRRLKQVIVNILDNASKHGRGGEINLTVEQSGGFVTITVRDHGPGIPVKDLPHVKERFYKGSSKERGSGIGLSVCDEIVTRHGGTLSIRNAADNGAVVAVSIPLKPKTP